MKNIAIGILLGIALKDTLLRTQFQNILAVAIATPIVLYPVDCMIESYKCSVRRGKGLKEKISRLIA